MVEVTSLHGRTKVGGRVMRTASGEHRVDRGTQIAPSQLLTVGDLTNIKEYPSTHVRDKALLVALGVDGDVQIAQARVNAGLDTVPSEATLNDWVLSYANNNEPAAIAA